MSTYLHFGENEFFLNRTIKQLKTHTLNQQWANFNHTEYPPESKETIPQALFRYHDTTSWEWRKISTFAQQHITGSLFKRNFVAVGVHSPQNSLNQ